MLSVLRDGQPHSREDIQQRVGFFLTNNAASELRDQGYEVKRWNKGRRVFYQLVSSQRGDGSDDPAVELPRLGSGVAQAPRIDRCARCGRDIIGCVPSPCSVCGGLDETAVESGNSLGAAVSSSASPNPELLVDAGGDPPNGDDGALLTLFDIPVRGAYA